MTEVTKHAGLLDAGYPRRYLKVFQKGMCPCDPLHHSGNKLQVPKAV